MRRLHVLVAFPAVIVATPALTWSLAGDLSTVDIPDPDYLFHAPVVSWAQQVAIGICSLVIVAAGTAVVVAGRRQELVTAREIVAIAPLIAAGIFVGLAARIVTAGVIGANIGGAMALMFGPFILLGLFVLSAVLWLQRGR